MRTKYCLLSAENGDAHRTPRGTLPLRLEVERENVRLTGLHFGRQVGGVKAAVLVGNCRSPFFSRALVGVAEDDAMHADGGAVAGLGSAERELAAVVRVAAGTGAFTFWQKRYADVG